MDVRPTAGNEGSEDRPHGDRPHQGAHGLAEAEELIERAEQDPTAARPAAVAALRALLLFWSQTPRGDRVGELLSQAAETDDTLANFMDEARVLDRDDVVDGTYERAKIFVDAARGRIVNI